MKDEIAIFLDYEIRASWWACLVSWGPLQNLASCYFAWKVGRKYRRYIASVRLARELGFTPLTDKMAQAFNAGKMDIDDARRIEAMQ